MRAKLRRNRTQAAVPPGSPTRLATLDDPVIKRSYKLEVTALKIK
jgi:hypothetical protein